MCHCLFKRRGRRGEQQQKESDSRELSAFRGIHYHAIRHANTCTSASALAFAIGDAVSRELSFATMTDLTC